MSFELSPPYANRGVQNTQEDSLRACVDWLQVTFKTIQNVEEIMPLLHLEMDYFTLFEDVGKYGYSSHYKFGHIAIYFSYTRSDIHLEISGQGCRELEEVKGFEGWSVFLAMLLMLDINVTRLDVAIDDFKGYFTLRKLMTKIINGEVRSRFKKGRILSEHELNTGNNTGETIYIGSPKSDIQIRFYDKKKERENKSKVVKEKVWIRTEIQLRDERAYNLAYLIAREEDDLILKTVVRGVLKNYINFVDKNPDDINKSRWAVSKFWTRYLNDVQKLKLTQIAPDRTIEKSEQWLNNSVSAALVTILQAYDYDLTKISELAMRGETKQSKKHLNMLLAFRYKEGKPIDPDNMERARDKFYSRLNYDRPIDMQHKKEKRPISRPSKESVMQTFKATNRNLYAHDSILDVE